MEELQLEIYRLRRENAALRHQLTTTNQLMAVYVQVNVTLEQQLKAVNGHFDRSLALVERLLEDNFGQNVAPVLSEVYHLKHPN